MHSICVTEIKKEQEMCIRDRVYSVPNIKSAKKRVELSKISNARNKMYKSTLKSTLKKFDTAVAEGDREKACLLYTSYRRKLT